MELGFDVEFDLCIYIIKTNDYKNPPSPLFKGEFGLEVFYT